MLYEDGKIVNNDIKETGVFNNIYILYLKKNPRMVYLYRREVTKNFPNPLVKKSEREQGRMLDHVHQGEILKLDISYTDIL